ncbi:polysaccharide deacetylase family protein [Mesorhizobium sp.]|uniref:polysaccharide deacetylase family protein n=1 Tax=Mesorhizobium sp. TaxID=1871066 RepID=UPI0025C5006C|nr:polysaccharide deacetylase family protein [Mesorhizobium sp.]
MAACRDRKRIFLILTPLRLAVLIVLFLAFPAGAADRTIYLTFDDGPLTGTSNILDVLEAEQVPATLFMVGTHAQASASTRHWCSAQGRCRW